jgi:hypothetical protein
MAEATHTPEEAQQLLESGNEPRALEILHELVHGTTDPVVRRRVHDLALAAHERAEGFKKIEWHKLAVESEAELTNVH